MPLLCFPETAAAMKVTPSRPTPASPALDTPAQNAAVQARIHCSKVNSGMSGFRVAEPRWMNWEANYFRCFAINPFQI